MIVTGGEALIDLVEDEGRLRAVAGGGPFNTAIAFGQLGVPVGYIGAISGDTYGRLLAQSLADAGVDTSLVRWSDAATPRAIVRRDTNGRHDYEFHLDGTAFSDLTPDQLPDLPAVAWGVHVGTLALAIDPPAAAYEALVKREVGKRRIVLDPNVRPEIFGDVAIYRARFERLAALTNLVKLSDDDAAWIYPGRSLDEVVELILDLGPGIVAVTRGPSGAIAASRHGFADVPGIRVDVVDTVGAGDSFGAAFVAALVDEAAFGVEVKQVPDSEVLERAVAYAVAASAITCTRTGAVPPTRTEIEAYLTAFAGDPR